MPELIDHHALEDVGLVVDVVEDVAPEGVERVRGHEEATGAHPEAVGEGGAGERDDEDGDQRADEHDERLGRDEVEEEPHDPGEEGFGRGAEVGEPVGDDGEEHGDQEEVGDAGDEVGDDEGCRAVQAVGTLLHE